MLHPLDMRIEWVPQFQIAVETPVRGIRDKQCAAIVHQLAQLGEYLYVAFTGCRRALQFDTTLFIKMIDGSEREHNVKTYFRPVILQLQWEHPSVFQAELSRHVRKVLEAFWRVVTPVRHGLEADHVIRALDFRPEAHQALAATDFQHILSAKVERLK